MVGFISCSAFYLAWNRKLFSVKDSWHQSFLLLSFQCHAHTYTFSASAGIFPDIIDNFSRNKYVMFIPEYIETRAVYLRKLERNRILNAIYEGSSISDAR